MEKQNISSREKDIEAFLKSPYFMRLGHQIQQENWQGLMMGIRNMQGRCKALELTEFEKQLVRLREAGMQRNVSACKQILATMIAKRVQLLNARNQGAAARAAEAEEES